MTRKVTTDKNGRIIVWKKVMSTKGFRTSRGRRLLVKMSIPLKAKVRYDTVEKDCSGYVTTARRMIGKLVTGKCRASQVEVLSFYTIVKGKLRKLPSDTPAFAIYRPWFEYKIGTVKPERGGFSKDAFSEDAWDICAPGIHFFVTRSEAKDFRF